jgi:hypothetical protein
MAAPSRSDGPSLAIARGEQSLWWMSCTERETGAGSEMAVIIEPEARRRAGGFLSRFPRANPKKCDRLYGVVAKFVPHSQRTDFGGRGLPEFPIISIFQPTRPTLMTVLTYGRFNFPIMQPTRGS